MTSSALIMDSLHCKWSFWHGPQRGTGPSDVVQAQCVHIRLGRGQCDGGFDAKRACKKR